MKQIRSTVIIPTCDRVVMLAATIDALASQTFDLDCFEVIVVDNGRREGVGELVRTARLRHPRLQLRWLRESRPGPGAARNRGIVHARGEIILFTDDDCRPEPDWVEAMLRAFDGDLAVVGVEGLTYTRVRELTPFVHFAAGAGGVYPTCNVGYRAGPLRAAGGFDAAAFPAANKEDVDLAYRMLRRGQVIFEPSARVFHPARSISFLQQVKRMRRLLTDELCMMGRWPRQQRQYAPTGSAAGVTWPDGRQEVCWSTPNPMRARILVSRSDLLRRRPLLYARIILLLGVRSGYALPLLPPALVHAWRHRRPRDPAPLRAVHVCTGARTDLH